MKYIFIDIDGTLYDHSQDCVPRSARNAIIKAHENGHKLYICTGRAMPEVSFYDLPFDGIVSSCGAYVEENGNCLFLAKYPTNDLKALIQHMIGLKIGFSLDGHKKSFLSDDVYHLFSKNFAKENSELARISLAAKNMYHLEDLKDEDLEQILKISLFCDEYEPCQKLLDYIPDSLDAFIQYNPTFNIVNGEITIKGVSKAHGVDIIINEHHANIEDTIALGDSLNDLEMIEHAYAGIAMGNSCQELKDKCDIITDDVSNDGLANAFRQLGLF